MTYNNIYKALFIERLNRFTATCSFNRQIETVYVKNTGRCKELLISGVEVYIQKNDLSSRKTKYSLITVNKNGKLINMDSQIPNAVVLEYLKNQPKQNIINDHINVIKTEKVYGCSRFDFYIETNNHKIFIEVKGVTLEKDNIALFPDAPTKRGVKHIHELINATNAGFKTYIIFVIQMEGVKYFTPNIITHKEFAENLTAASKKGVNILAFDCKVGYDFITINKPVEIRPTFSTS